MTPLRDQLRSISNFFENIMRNSSRVKREEHIDEEIKQIGVSRKEVTTTRVFTQSYVEEDGTILEYTVFEIATIIKKQ